LQRVTLIISFGSLWVHCLPLPVFLRSEDQAVI
jgi:hypothetical protein